jgi:SAM-dependent methyltransferase
MTSEPMAISQPSSYVRWKKWNEFGRVGDAARSRFAREVALLGLATNARILEIGFGSGEFLSWAAEQGYRIAGTEHDVGLLSAARTAGFEVCASTEFGPSCPDSGELFDAVVAFDVLEHLDPDAARQLLLSAADRMTPNGKILLQFPNGSSPFGGHFQNGDLTHRQSLTRGSLDQLLDGTGLAITAWRRPAQPCSRRVDFFIARARGAAFAALAAGSRVLYGAHVDWWPVATATIEWAGE